MRQTFTSVFSLCLSSLVFLATSASADEVAVSLSGSPTSMQRQNNVATDLGYEFVETPTEVDLLVEEGDLVLVPGNGHYEVLRTVSYPYARPEVRMFIERIASQYYEATGEKLVVTSLLRPTTRQPRNSHELSVHPTGIAIDLRISSRRASQQWLESVLLKLERQGLLDVTRERWPPHYHVALFPQAYRAHVTGLVGEEAVQLALDYAIEEEEPEVAPIAPERAVVSAPEHTAAAAVSPIEDVFGAEHLAALGAVLLAGLFFGLGYWRGVASIRANRTSKTTPWPAFTVSTTQSVPPKGADSAVGATSH